MSELLRGRRGIVVVLAAAGVIALVGVTAAFAAGGDDDGDENIRGSMAVPEGIDPEDEAALQDLAQIDQSAAENAALEAVPGTVEETELEAENGFVIYEVEVEGEDGETREVMVDAGNGRVLGQETE
jgi:uncharacterized membrane protein YkoI